MLFGFATGRVLRASAGVGARAPVAVPRCLALRIPPSALGLRPVVRLLAQDATRTASRAGQLSGEARSRSRVELGDPALSSEPEDTSADSSMKRFIKPMLKIVVAVRGADPDAFEPVVKEVMAIFEESVEPTFREHVIAGAIHELARRHLDGRRAEALMRAMPSMGLVVMCKHVHPVISYHVGRDDPKSWLRVEEWLSVLLGSGKAHSSIAAPERMSSDPKLDPSHRPEKPTDYFGEGWPLLQCRAIGYTLLGDFEAARRAISVPSLRKQIDWAMIYALTAILRRAFGVHDRVPRDGRPAAPDEAYLAKSPDRIRAILGAILGSGPVWGNTRSMTRDWARRLCPPLIPAASCPRLADLLVPLFEGAAAGLGMDLLAGLAQGFRAERADPAPLLAAVLKHAPAALADDAAGPYPVPREPAWAIAVEIARAKLLWGTGGDPALAGEIAALALRCARDARGRDELWHLCGMLDFILREPLLGPPLAGKIFDALLERRLRQGAVPPDPENPPETPIASIFGRTPDEAPSTPSGPPSAAAARARARPPPDSSSDLSGYVARWVNLLAAQRTRASYEECYAVCCKAMEYPKLLSKETYDLLHLHRKTSHLVLDAQGKDRIRDKLQRIREAQATGSRVRPASYASLAHAVAALGDLELAAAVEEATRGAARTGAHPVWVEANVAHLWAACGQFGRAWLHVAAAEEVYDRGAKNREEAGYMGWMYESLAFIFLQGAPEAQPSRGPQPRSWIHISSQANNALALVRRAAFRGVPLRPSVRRRVERVTGRRCVPSPDGTYPDEDEPPPRVRGPPRD